jgi:hypothetical protein
MNRRKQSSQMRVKLPAYRQAFERLDAALAENTPCNNIEKIRRLRIAMFGDVDALEKSGKIKIPE